MRKTKELGNTTIFFLRHGEPDNPQQIIKGTADFILTEKGEKQILSQAQLLLRERMGALFTSPVLRCVQTAKIVAKILNEDRTSLDKDGRPVGPGGLRIRRVNELIEWTSAVDGQPQAEAQKMGRQEFIAAFEPHEKVISRMKVFVKKILTKYSGQTVIAVSHQGPIDLLLMDLAGEDYSQTPFKGLTTQKGEMIKVKFNPKGEIVKLERIEAGA